MFAAPWITATRQGWKLLVLCVLLGGMVLLVITHLLTHNRGLFPLWGLFILPIAFGWMALAFRCPQCMGRVGWWYLRHKGVTEWFTDFVSARKCPLCGHEGPSLPPVR